jgi:peroxiredoxin
VRKFAQKLGVTFEILHNQDGSIQQIYQTSGVPENFLIDRDGTIMKHVIGAAQWDSPGQQEFIRRLLDAR